MPKDFGLDPSTKVKDEIADAWAAARAYWAAYQVKISRLKEGATGTTETRNQWLVPLLGLLGYQLTLAESETLQGKTYRISHRDPSRDQLPVHLIGWHESLDRRSTVPNAPRMSPHGLVQEYLNLTEHLIATALKGGTGVSPPLQTVARTSCPQPLLHPHLPSAPNKQPKNPRSSPSASPTSPAAPATSC